jgi:hypothetical protein
MLAVSLEDSGVYAGVDSPLAMANERKPTMKTIGVRVPQALQDRAEREAARFPGVKKSVVYRVAFRLGLRRLATLKDLPLGPDEDEQASRPAPLSVRRKSGSAS